LELLRPSSLDDAAAALANGSVALAGGTDLVPLLRDRIVEAETLVLIGDVVPRGVQKDGGPGDTTTGGPGYTSTGVGVHRPSLTIGAGTTLAELEEDPAIPDALREACRLAASQQLRSMGTIAGNLLQATRCWYWRLKYPCWLHGGDRCHAREGQHREHAIFANERCASAHPSDPAAALVALGATMRTTTRELTVGDLYRLPTDDDRNITALAPGELILELGIPDVDTSVYLKAMDRRRWAFPLVGVAAARVKGETRLALAGVAPIPWLLDSAEALDQAAPMPGNAYKVDVARALVRRALAALA